MLRSLILFLVLFLMVLSLPTFGDDQASPTDNSNKQESSSRPHKGSTKAELEALRTQVASQQKTMESQQKTIEELKTMVGQLAQRLDSSSRVLPASYNPVELIPQQIPSSPPGKPSTPSTLVESKTPKASNAVEWTVAGTTIQIYGHADLSYDYVDNGINSAIEAAVVPAFPVPNNPLRANNGWLGQISSNLSYFGVRGSHKINDYLTGVFQFETEVGFSDIPGATSDNNCKFCLGGRDSYVGVQGHWGAVKIGKAEAPYKKAIVPLDPFYNTLGDHRSIMGNSGGDNRDEFETRIPHAIWYESPSSHGLAAAILFSPGQNRSADNGAYARGEPICSGGNGVFVISFQNRANVAEAVGPDINPCNDGAWGNVLSTAVTYKGHGFYGFGGYEHHSTVNRLIDAVGVADEAAWRFGASYTFESTGTTGSFVYEGLKRYAANTISGIDGQPVKFAALDERTRPLATMVVLSQKLSKKDVLSADWIHAGKTPGDPGQCVAFDPNGACTGFASLTGVPGTASSLVDAVNNSSNMYAFGLRHTLTRNMSTYFVAARQANHADSHYDLGAVGHGIVVDKRDFTGTGIPGTRLQGISGGMTFDF
jgi:predicted porin